MTFLLNLLRLFYSLEYGRLGKCAIAFEKNVYGIVVGWGILQTSIGSRNLYPYWYLYSCSINYLERGIEISSYNCGFVYLSCISSVFVLCFFLIFIYLFIWLCWDLRRSTWDPLLWRLGFRVAAHGLTHPVACGILVLQPGIKPVSPALEGGFLTMGPPGKSLCHVFWNSVIMCIKI